jgi:MarR family transcriptional regulator for hemolysin
METKTVKRAVSDEKFTSNFEIYRNKMTTKPIALTVALVLTARRWRALVDENLRSIGQSSARMEALGAIMNSPDPSAQVDIAKRLRIEGPTLTRMIDVLSKDGLVERKPAPGDRRTKHLALTEAGFDAMVDIFAIVDDMRYRLLDGMSEEEMVVLTKALNTMLARLDEGLPKTAQA